MELKSFNGEIANYDNWRRRVRDHFTGVNMFYKDIFDLVESEKTTIAWSRLATLKVAVCCPTLIGNGSRRKYGRSLAGS